MRLLKLSATWCGPCKLMRPIVEQFSKSHPDIKVEDIDVDQNPGLAQSFGVSSIPTIIVFNDDGTINKLIKGLKSLKEIEQECGL